MKSLAGEDVCPNSPIFVTSVAHGPGARRQADLDVFRALAMIWVLMIHCLYLTPILKPRWDVPKSLLLIEMPVFFYLAGASNGLTRTRSLLRFYASRLFRIALPLWVYGA